MGIGLVAAGCPRDGIVMPGISGAAACDGAAFLGALFFAGFFFAAGAGCAGIFMPGMSIVWADAGSAAAANAAVHSRNGEVFTEAPRKKGISTPGGLPGVESHARLSSCSSCRCRDCSGSRLPWRSRTCSSGRRRGSCGRSFQVSFLSLLKASESPYSLRTMVQSQAAQPLSIGKLAAAGGVGVETIRYYQRRGLLETPSRDREIRRYGS